MQPTQIENTPPPSPGSKSNQRKLRKEPGHQWPLQLEIRTFFLPIVGEFRGNAEISDCCGYALSGNNTSSQPLSIFWCKISEAKIKLLNLSVHIPKVHEVAYSYGFELLSELICIYVMSGWWLTMLTMCGNR